MMDPGIGLEADAQASPSSTAVVLSIFSKRAGELAFCASLVSHRTWNCKWLFSMLIFTMMTDALPFASVMAHGVIE